MATITIKNVPEATLKRIGATVNFDEVEISKKRTRKDPTIRLQKMMDDPENTSYGPFSPKEFLKQMKSW